MTDEQRKLIEDNHNLIYSFLYKYHLEVNEYYDLAAIGLCKATITFDSEKASFYTYACKCMFSSVFSEIRRKYSSNRIPEEQILYYQKEMENDDGDSLSFIDYISSKENIEEDVLSDIMINEYLSSLKDRDKQIFILFTQGHNQKEIGKILGIDQSFVSRRKKKFIEHFAMC